jgi:methionyl-tRNA formyltransferase
MGCIGMHPTLLPVGRGRAAIPWAILKQVPETGVTLFKLDEGVDTGNIIGQEKIKLDPSITATELYEKINLLHICLINKFWDDIVNNKVVLFIQDESKATEWTERKPEDGEILSKMTVEEAERLVRAVTKPYPGAFYIEGKKKTIIWSAKIDKFKGQIRFKDGYLNPVDYDVEYLS